MDYVDAGYDAFLSRTPPAPTGELDPLQQDLYSPEISASKIQGGLLQTADGKTAVDLEQGFFRVNDGATEVVRLGVQEDGTIGLLIRDRDGNELLRFVGSTNILRSPQGNMELNFNETQLLLRDDGGTPFLLFGKQVGGF